jgi:hypothetical protein
LYQEEAAPAKPAADSASVDIKKVVMNK